MKKLFIVLIICISISAGAFAMEDTSLNRQKETDRYLQTTPPDELMKNMAENMAMNFPPEQRAEFKTFCIKHMDIKAITKIMRDGMIKHFTASEIKALADFYGSPVGKSAMKNFGPYMADIMPAIQAEALKAYAEVIKEQAELNRQKQDKKE